MRSRRQSVSKFEGVGAIGYLMDKNKTKHSELGKTIIINFLKEAGLIQYENFKIKDLRKPESTKLPAFSLKPYFW